jgi:class 3 adenylate cyclase
VEPRIQYTTSSDGVSLAYREFGAGPAMVVLPALPLSHLQAEWRMPGWRAFMERFGATHRVARYDARGVGLSERASGPGDLDDHVNDLRAVISRLFGEEPVVLFAPSYSGPTGIAFAARYPDSVSRLVLWCTHACMEDVAGRLTQAQLDQRRAVQGLAAVDWDLFIRTYLHRAVGWGEGEQANQFATLARHSMEPEQFFAALARYELFDARPYLGAVAAPTLVLHRPMFPGSNVEVAKGLAARIRDCRLALLEGDSVAPFVGDVESVLVAVEEFLGVDGRPAPERELVPVSSGNRLRTLLFTDIENHTEMMSRLGDERGREVLRHHEALTRAALRRFDGDEIKSLGDGFLASFGSTQRALECAIALQQAFEQDLVPGEAIRIRVGINAGEPIVEDDDLFGATVIATSRIALHARGGEVLVSMVVRELAAGKGFAFADRGNAELRGFEEPMRVYELQWREQTPI